VSRKARANSLPEGELQRKAKPFLYPSRRNLKKIFRCHTSAPRYGQRPHRSRARLQEHPGALVERRTGGQNIVDQEQILAEHQRPAAKIERIPEILHAPAPIKMSLGYGVANALQGVQNGKVVLSCQPVGQDLCLVKFPFALAQRMQGNWHNGIETAVPQSRIIEPLSEKIS
jgi:hypothetical protein